MNITIHEDYNKYKDLIMLITNTNYIPKHNNIKTEYKNNNFNKQQVSSYKPVLYNHIIANKGIHFGSKNINQLYDEYNWYINHDHTPAVDAFLKIDDDKETMDGFLTAILNTDDRSYQFIDSIVKQPRQMQKISSSLKDKVGSNSMNVMTFFPNSPYYSAYDKYLDKKYEQAHTLSELLRVRPDWKGDKLIEKHRQLKGNDSLEIGCIPKEFPNDHIFKIADYLSGFMEDGMKSQKDVNSITLDNREYEFKFFTEGRSDKNVFGVFTPEKKKFVLKMARPNMKSLDNPFSLGTLAKIDTYLTTNRSRNSAPLCYYNHDKNFSVYKYIEHTPINAQYNDLNVIAEHLPDFRSLGLSYNDTVGNKNFFLLDESSNQDMINSSEGYREALDKGEWISVDNDHVTYNQSLNPSMNKYTALLPMAMQMFF